MLPDKTYLLRIVYRDGNVEIIESTQRHWAESNFSVFDENDVDICTEVQLIERDWTKDEDNCDTIIKRWYFNESTGGV